MMTITQAASYLCISERRVRALCQQGRIPGADKIGRDWLLPDNPTVTEASRQRPSKVTITSITPG